MPFLIQGPCQLEFSAKNEREMKAKAAGWWNFPLTVGTNGHGNLPRFRALFPQPFNEKE
jgi:hypothetical protein